MSSASPALQADIMAGFDQPVEEKKVSKKEALVPKLEEDQVEETKTTEPVQEPTSQAIDPSTSSAPSQDQNEESKTDQDEDILKEILGAPKQ